MRWRGREQSSNVEDRRGSGGGGFRFPIPGGGGGGRGGGLGVIGIVVVLGLAFFFGIDPRILMDGMGGGPTQTQQQPDGGGVQIPDIVKEMFPDLKLPGGDSDSVDAPSQPRDQIKPTQTGSDDEMKQFVAVVLRDTETVWDSLFQQFGQQYREPSLVLFEGATRSACGLGQAAMGPFYCPADGKVYIDLSFFRELKNRFKAPGDFAQAYVIAHEVGHHVQTLLGISEKVMEAKSRMSERQANAVQVRMELQADCLAGVWAHNADKRENILEEGDIDEALNAAAAIGDDRIQKQTQGQIVPDAFTHGSSEMRQRWFRRGFSSGEMDQCDTFNADEL
jgi:predicted metalloprotease